MPLVALSPALSPLLGVFLLDHFSWRAIFVVLALMALSATVLVMLGTIPFAWVGFKIAHKK